ncbi:MAG: hypothetical protein IMY78_00350 [Chloroflexi bacterium]|nr:hypothetical protein [Chloroflexota bacterium]
MSKTSGLRKHCDRCLETRRWNGSVVLMVVDAAFTSIGLNYFTAVVPSVVKFEKELTADGKIGTLRDLSLLQPDQVESIWRNLRSWQVAKGAASYLHNLAVADNLDDRGALRRWAANSRLESWKEDPIGTINGVGITTFQYLRMMGGMDTAMPDKIVRRVIRQILEEAALDMPVQKDMELISTIERMAELSGYRSIEICWMTWMIQSEGNAIRMEKYRDLLDKI